MSSQRNQATFSPNRVVLGIAARSQDNADACSARADEKPAASPIVAGTSSDKRVLAFDPKATVGSLEPDSRTRQ